MTTSTSFFLLSKTLFLNNIDSPPETLILSSGLISKISRSLSEIYFKFSLILKFLDSTLSSCEIVGNLSF